MADFATFIIERGAATQGEVAAALGEQQRTRSPVGRIALQMGLLDSAEIFAVLAHQTRNAPIRFGEAAITLGLLKRAHVDAILLAQRKQTTPLEEILLKAGAIDAAMAISLRAAYELEQPPSSTTRVPRPAMKRAG